MNACGALELMIKLFGKKSRNTKHFIQSAVIISFLKSLLDKLSLSSSKSNQVVSGKA